MGLGQGSGEALGGLLGPRRVEKEFQEGSLIVLELQVDLVSRKKGPQEVPTRALKEAQKGS